MTLDTFRTGSFVGQSAWARRTRCRIAQLAARPANILFAGPTGTGKQLIARLIHSSSNRSTKPFIPVDCAAISGPLFASQLFGHAKGAWAAVQHASMGCLVAAQGGTIYLANPEMLKHDEQRQLARVLTTRQLYPVGSCRPIILDVRAMAGISEGSLSGRLVPELATYLSGSVWRTQPLAGRPEDIAPLVRHLVAKVTLERGLPLKAFTPAAMALLETYRWPENVDELERVIESLVDVPTSLLVDAGEVADYVGVERVTFGSGSPAATTRASQRDAAVPPNTATCESVPEFEAVVSHWPTLQEMEAEHIRRTLAATFFCRPAAARLLNIDPDLLAEKMRAYRIDETVTMRGCVRNHFGIG